MELSVAMGYICQRQRVTESDSNPKLPEKEGGGKKKICKLSAEQKRNHLENYVDSPLCRRRQLILCSKAGSEVKRGWS